MDRIVIDIAALSKLAGCKAPVAVYNETGQMVGIFEPTASLVPPIDEAELDRRESEASEEYSTAEVLQYLESL